MPFDNLVYALFLNIINSNNDEVVTTLEGHNLDIHTKLNKYGWTPLHAAAFKGNASLVQYLLSKGANKDYENASGMSPKMLALEAGHTNIAELMDQAGQPSEYFLRVETGEFQQIGVPSSH
eukprot:CAMPEP_0176438648 /NCGR_PEP_ID=MMETSP0127-20121128/19424_1 /TAXON_ID=938130 /ORGANISM="Platyophrya macrostoma, Strain WH" /LENGTH=120 /DNA_ID=CAMNT_0017822669 /DNA_START=60 /DNA_END=422 /DNA_ORIENTATION=-